MKDLGGRLPYGVKILDVPVNVVGKLFLISTTDTVQYETADDTGMQTLYNIKPYLLPLSSMTEEEQRTLDSMCNDVEMVSRLSGLKMFTKHLIGSMKIISTIEALLKRDLLLMQQD